MAQKLKNKAVCIEFLDHCTGGGEPVMIKAYGEVAKLQKKYLAIVSLGLVSGARENKHDDLFTIVRSAIRPNGIKLLVENELLKPKRKSIVKIEYIIVDSLYRVYGRIISINAKSIELAVWEVIGENVATTVENDERVTIIRSAIKNITVLE